MFHRYRTPEGETSFQTVRVGTDGDSSLFAVSKIGAQTVRNVLWGANGRLELKGPKNAPDVIRWPVQFCRVLQQFQPVDFLLQQQQYPVGHRIHGHTRASVDDILTLD